MTCTKLLKIDNAFTCKTSLDWALDNPEFVEGMQEYLDNSIDYTIENVIEMYFTDLSWIDYYNISDYIHESIPDIENIGCAGYDESDVLEFGGWEDNYLFLDHQNGYYLSHQIGDEIKAGHLDSANNQQMLDMNDPEDFNKPLVFIGTIDGVGEEQEFQANNGNCAYHYNGPNYFEVWIDKRFYKKPVGQDNDL